MTDVTLGGRVYTVANMEQRTLLHDVHIRQIFQRTGLDRILPDRSETAESYSARLCAELLISGALCDILGLYLLPLGKTERDWTPALAAEITRAVSVVDTDADRQLAQQLAAEAVLGFFLRELRSLVTFRSSFVAGSPANGSDATAAH